MAAPSWVARPRAVAIAVLALLFLIAPAAALADGDPASDVLIGRDVFYPYDPGVSSSLQSHLNTLTAQARASGFPIKVALIDTRADLGTLPELFDKPRQYAQFLDEEISLAGQRLPLLVVMPNGYGVAGLPPAASTVVAALPGPAGKPSNDLAQAAIAAIKAIAAATGHHINKNAVIASGDSGNSTTLMISLVAALALLGAGAVIGYRVAQGRRPRAAPAQARARPVSNSRRRPARTTSTPRRG